MITEDYVSFEVAKLLKEKGFNELCSRYYNSQFDEMRTVGDICMMNWNSISINDEFYYISIPTHQMAMKWLREVHSLSVETFSIKGTSNVCPVFWKGNVVKLLTQDRVFSGELVSSYEEAVEAAFKYTLKYLI